MLPRLVGDTRQFVDQLFSTIGPLLAGFDFPIGVPVSYGQLIGVADFPSALDVFGQGEWAEFHRVAETPQQVSRIRPFYPRASTGGSRQVHLRDGLGIEFEALRRRCERSVRPAPFPSLRPLHTSSSSGRHGAMESHRRCRCLIPVSRTRLAAPQSVNVTTPFGEVRVGGARNPSHGHSKVEPASPRGDRNQPQHGLSPA